MTPTDASQATLPLRDRKRAAARAKVVDAAIRLFADRGYGEVSVAEICEVADVAPRSFYRYFPTKEDVLLEPMREMADRVETAITDAPPELDDRQALEHGLRELARYVLAGGEQLSRYFRVIGDTTAVRASPQVQLADRERRIAEHLLRRRGASPPADWRTRLLVARTVAGFRVWMEDFRQTDLPDPMGHLDLILETDDPRPSGGRAKAGTRPPGGRVKEGTRPSGAGAKGAKK